MKAHFSVLAFTTFMFATAWTSPGYPIKESAEVKQAKVVAEGGDFTFFRTHRQGRGITASWGVASGAGIVGFQLQKTYEDPTDPYAIWEDISSIPCNGSRSYKSTDNNVSPGSINYRVVAQKADGSSSASGLSAVRIVSR